MVFEWLHTPSESGYNRRRHLSRTPPEFWSRHDKMHAGQERSKYFRALHKEYKKHGGTYMSESAQRRFHARFPGGEGYYFPYADALGPPHDQQFRAAADDLRHGYRFRRDVERGDYGDLARLLWDALVWRQRDVDPPLPPHATLDDLMDFVELDRGTSVEGPLGWGFRGDRPNERAWEDLGVLHAFGIHGVFHRPGGPRWDGRL